ncbi:MAG: hypothetical protein KGO96_04885 [Elusimicrobia bacterium]|nr:hypothetical protein [Elusimicrobiota bacterium]MDE2237018.1 hypothetical protein [Elusimicrobiota bacterium]MDE2425226.1 hypothetical protein [Elusimicrobiota bacterium]
MIKDTLEKLEAAVKAGDNAGALRALARLKTELGGLNQTHLELRANLQSFEASHPALVKALDTLSRMLAQLGI